MRTQTATAYKCIVLILLRRYKTRRGFVAGFFGRKMMGYRMTDRSAPTLCYRQRGTRNNHLPETAIGFRQTLRQICEIGTHKIVG